MAFFHHLLSWLVVYLMKDSLVVPTFIDHSLYSPKKRLLSTLIAIPNLYPQIYIISRYQSVVAFILYKCSILLHTKRGNTAVNPL